MGSAYLLKFDAKGIPETETAADVIVQRILWACGYNTPEDEIVYFHRNDLVVDKKAEVKDTFGNKRPMTDKDLEDGFARINHTPGKPIRGLVSKFLSGVPLGGFPPSGVRKDDPNDLVPHQHRRDIRGLEPIAAWLGHTDVKRDNTLDVWTTDAGNPAVKYVVRYQIDFGKALGTMGWGKQVPCVGLLACL